MSVFVDTSGWACLLDAAQHGHREARARSATASPRDLLVTSNYVLAELVPLLDRRSRMPRGQQVQMIRDLKRSSRIRVIHLTPSQDTAAWKLLGERLDKAWSLVDCSSFVLMRELHLAEALTTDRHFEQAGFVRLLR